MKKRILSLIALVGLIGGIALIPASADAQSPTGGLQISPTRVDWTFDLGDERVGQVNLKNYTKEAMKVEVEVEDFTVNDDSTDAEFYVPGNTHPLKAYDVIDWVSFDAGDHPVITIPAEESVDVKFKVNIPDSTPTGGYYGAIFFRTLPDDEIADPNGTSSVIGVSQRIGTLLLMGVRGVGPMEKKGAIESFEAEKGTYGSSPVELDTRFKNTGNMHFPVYGSVTIQKFGKDIKEFDLDSRMTYPGKNRLYENEWEFGNWSFGKYKAVANMKSEDGTITDEAEVSFWVIPFKTTIILAVLIILIVVGVVVFGKKFEMKGDKKK